MSDLPSQPAVESSRPAGLANRRTIEGGCCVVLAAVAAALAFYRLGATMPWADEMQTVGYCLGTWGDGLYLATHSQNMPVGYWLISKVLLGVTGPGFLTMRAASGVAFVLFAVLMFRLLLRWLPLPVAAMATLVVVTHPALVWHARDGRVYAILMLAEAPTVALLTSRPFRGRAVLWAATAVAMVYLHHHAVFVLAVEVLIILEQRMALRRVLPWVAVLLAPDALFIYWAMHSPNVASQMFGAGQTFGPNVMMAIERLGAGVSEMVCPPDMDVPGWIQLPIPPAWRQAMGGTILIVPTLITAVRGRRLHSWLGLAIVWLLVAPAVVHDALDVFYEPRFIIAIIPLAAVWAVGGLMLPFVRGPGTQGVRVLDGVSAPLWAQLPALAVSAVLTGLFVWTDLAVIQPHISPYRPAQAAINTDLDARPGKIVIHPGYLIGCWHLPQGFETAGGVVLSETGAMVGVEKEMADENAARYPPEMPWSRFRRDVVRGESFTLIQGAPPFYPRSQADFCKPDEPWDTGYRRERLWSDHPFVTIIRFERVP